MPQTIDQAALDQLCTVGLLSTKEIAYAAGVSEQHVYECRAGRRTPSPRLFNDVAKYARRWAQTDPTRYVSIIRTVALLVLRDVPAEVSMLWECDERLPVEALRRELGTLCEDVGALCKVHADITADGRIDRADESRVSELNVKGPILIAHVQAMLRHVNGAYSNAERKPQ